VKAKEKDGGFTWRRLSRPAVANGGAVVPAVPAVLVAAPLFFLLPFSLFFSSFFLFGSSFFLLFRSYHPSPSTLSYLFLCPLSSVFSAPSFFLVLSPVFIGKTGEREAGGGHYATTPKTARGTHLLPLLQHVESFGQVGLVSVFLRESWRWKTEEEKKSSSSLASRVQGKKKTYGAV